MPELNRRWTRGRIRYHLLLRWWTRNPLRSAWRWLHGPAYDGDRPEWWPLRTLTQNGGECYCPTGSTTRMRVNAFDCGFIFWLSRDWGERPCVCDKVTWLTFPEHHGEDIEDYGRERLLTEFPEYRASVGAVLKGEG